MTSTFSNGVSSTLRRTSSFANALKSLAGNIAFPTVEDGRSSPKPQPNAQERTEIVQGVSRPPSPNLSFAQYTSPYPGRESPDDDYAPSTSYGSTLSPSDSQPPAANYYAWDVMEALMEEDMERLRARRPTGGHSRHHSHHRENYGGAASPSGSTFSTDSSVILGLGTGVGLRDVLPLSAGSMNGAVSA